VYAVVVDQGQLYTDLTGKFPVRYSKGNSYVMVCYVYDCNYVKVIPMKSRSAYEWVKAYDTIHQELTVKGFKPKLQTLNNEASTALKNFFTINDIAYQFVPHHYYRRKATERAIRTFKEHFVAGISSVDPAFPLHLWNRLLPQAEITLNLLRTSRLHPQLSAAAHFHGIVDYNKTAFAPPGCKIIEHGRPGKRCNWAPHGQHGYSLGPAMHQYQCQNVYISATASERIVDTLKLFPHNYQMPQLSSTNRLLVAAKDMTEALQNHHPEVPFPRVGDDTISALADLAKNFKLKLRQTPSPTPQAVPPEVFQRPCLVDSSNQILNYPMPLERQTRSQTTIHTQDPTVLMPLNDIATEQTKATEKIQATTNQLLDYLATHPDATIRYHASDMILHIHSDASYLSVSNTRSRLGGLFFLGNKSPEQDILDGSILNVAAVIKNVVASTDESEVEACFHNAQSGAPLRFTLTKLGHTQPPTPLGTYNATAFGILNEKIKQKRSKAMDMRYHWLTDRVRQKQFDVYWQPGREKLGDYHTKHHSAQHHKDMRGLILHQANILQVL
jgi:hypothetical protein